MCVGPDASERSFFRTHRTRGGRARESIRSGTRRVAPSSSRATGNASTDQRCSTGLVAGPPGRPEGSIGVPTEEEGRPVIRMARRRITCGPGHRAAQRLVPGKPLRQVAVERDHELSGALVRDHPLRGHHAARPGRLKRPRQPDEPFPDHLLTPARLARREHPVVVVSDRDEEGRRHAAGIVGSVSGIALSVTLVEAKEGKDAADHLAAGHRLDEFVPLVIQPQGGGDDGDAGDAGIAEQDDEDTADRSTSRSRDSNRATEIVKLAVSQAVLFHTPEGTAYADIDVGGHRETWQLRSTGFRTWLSHLYYVTAGKAASGQALTDALVVLDGEARFASPELPVFVRVAPFESGICIDLGTRVWNAIAVTSQGWHVVDSPPVRFRRARGMLAIPTPVSGGKLEPLLRPFLNVGSNETYCLVVSWLLAALRDRGPYPIAVIQGEHGSAKSTLARVCRALVDPSSVPLRRPVPDERSLAIAAGNAWVLALDNLSGLQPWLSDALCSLATGGGFGTRALFTDADEALFNATRPVIINGIDDLLTRPDLTDRALVLQLPRIADADRQDEVAFWDKFEKARPQIFGALLDVISFALGQIGRIRLTRLPRMADFAKWITAAEPSLNWPTGAFLGAYAGNQAEAVETGLDTDLVAIAVRGLLGSRRAWSGTATDLLDCLTGCTPESAQRGRTGWPRTARGLSDRLRRLAPTLRAVGIDVEYSREPRSRRRLIHLRADSGRGADSCGPSVPSGPTAPNHPANGPDGDATSHDGDAPGTHAGRPEDRIGTQGDAGDAEIAPFPCEAKDDDFEEGVI